MRDFREVGMRILIPLEAFDKVLADGISPTKGSYSEAALVFTGVEIGKIVCLAVYLGLDEILAVIR
jgi:hypothetical protein